VREVDLVVLDAPDREGEIDLERAHVGVHLVRAVEVDLGQAAEDLVPLRHVALVQAVVRLDRRAGDAVELVQLRPELAGPDLDEVRHAVSSRARAGTRGSISFCRN
jgi:hypothetical protein